MWDALAVIFDISSSLWRLFYALRTADEDAVLRVICVHLARLDRLLLAGISEIITLRSQQPIWVCSTISAVCTCGRAQLQWQGERLVERFSKYNSVRNQGQRSYRLSSFI